MSETTTYLATCDAHGPISREIEATSIDDVLALLESHGQSWKDEPATDAEDAIGMNCEGMNAAEFAEILRSNGYDLVYSEEGDGWRIWS